MGFRDILVLLTLDETSEQRLTLAAQLAQRHDAYLSGACIVNVPMPPGLYSGIGVYGGEAFALELNAELQDRAADQVEMLRAWFQDTLRREGLRGDWHGLAGPDGTSLTGIVRASDIAVFGQCDPKNDDQRLTWQLTESTLLRCGRPILVVPFIGAPPTFGETVLIGWNGSREAVRAIHDALPLLQGAKMVTLLSVNSQDADEGYVPGADMATHLARHGVTVTTARTASAGLEVSDVLLDYAADSGSDCIIAGGYGHSPMRETIFGGTTYGLLQHMTVPVLLSN